MGNDDVTASMIMTFDPTRRPALTQAERWEQWTAPETLEECVALFFELIDTVETSDSGRDFKPNRMEISSCRVWDTHRLNRIIQKMKALSTREAHSTPDTGRQELPVDTR